MKRMLIALVGAFVVIQGFTWWQTASDRDATSLKEQRVPPEPMATLPAVKRDTSPVEAPTDSELRSPAPRDAASGEREGFPEPTVQIVNGRPERTIHMGVRQYAWEPSTILAKQGELVRLIIHNADVQHGLAIPELNVLNIDIPPEGAVIEFLADKVGTFEFFCSSYCGDGHMEMQGTITIE